ncbi:MAG: LysR family transcriptional regulator [Pseudorhodoplanes sp.]|uniref:LysR family transcriptional regulator n=1 Tax=Pseudorhodoplanes sp. TaxID=1934341 RepID=UPI003D0CBD30
MIELKHLRAFIAVAEERHFRRAAERLNTSQSAVSKLITNLEAAVGVPLLLRSSRRVEIAPGGKELLRSATDILRKVDDAIKDTRRAAAGVRGHLTVGYMDVAIIGQLPALISKFCASYPDVAIDLVYLWTDLQRTMLLAGDLDIGFLHGPFDAEDIESELFLRDGFVVVLPEGHRLAGRKRIGMKDLADEPFVVGLRDKWRPLIEQIMRMCAQEDFQPKIVQEVHLREAIFGFVAAGLGVTIYPQSARNVPRKGVKFVDLHGTPERAEIFVAWKKANSNPSLPLLVDFIHGFNAETAA